MTFRSCRCSWLLLATLACGPGPAATSEGGSASSTGTTAPGTTGTSGPPTTSGSGSATGGSSGPGSTGGATTGTQSSTGGATTGSSGSTGDATTGSSGSTATSAGESTGGVAGCGGVEFVLSEDHAIEAGIELCPDGAAHRHTAVACPFPLAVKPCENPNFGCFKDPAACEVLGDGLCNTVYDISCRCQYPCEIDADCAPGAACLCNSVLELEMGGTMQGMSFSQCVRADCRTDADCPEGRRCNLSPGICGDYVSLHCETAEDECLTGQECFEKKLGNLCQFSPEQQRWVCTEMAFCE